MAKLIAKTYGEALFELAMEEKKLDSFLEETKMLALVLEQNPEFDKLMKNPRISKAEKQDVMGKVFAGVLSDEMNGFLALLISKERYGELKSIIQYFTDRVKEEMKIGVAFVTSATELSDEKKEAVKKRLLETTSYESMEMNYIVDKDIIGGMVIRIKDRVVDTSIRTKLAKMKKQLLQIQLG